MLRSWGPSVQPPHPPDTTPFPFKAAQRLANVQKCWHRLAPSCARASAGNSSPSSPMAPSPLWNQVSSQSLPRWAELFLVPRNSSQTEGLSKDTAPNAGVPAASWSPAIVQLSLTLAWDVVMILPHPSLEPLLALFTVRNRLPGDGIKKTFPSTPEVTASFTLLHASAQHTH